MPTITLLTAWVKKVTYISQGSVATLLGFGELFSDVIASNI